MKRQKSALFKSLLALLLCVSMLTGTTFAWFTDSVKSGINTIAAGTLDVEMYHSNAAVQNEKVNAGTKLFMDLQGNSILWEPGVVSYENLRIVNEGDLALAYQLAINTANENFVVDPSGAMYGLSQILKVGVVEDGVTATDRQGVVASVGEGNWITLASFLRNGSLLPEGKGASEKTWGIVIYWEPGENDNLWNLNNGKTLSSGDVLSIDLGVKLVATQEQYESDSFGNDYDATAKTVEFPAFVGGSTSATVVPDDQNRTTEAVTMVIGDVMVVVPAGVQLKAGVSQLTLSVGEMNNTGSNVQLGADEIMRSLDVHIDGVAEDNTTPIVVTLTEVAPTGLNMGNYQLYHVENGNTVEMTLVEQTADFSAHNQFKYDPSTGTVILYMATFSEVAMVAEEPKWEGGVDHSWYTNAVSQLAEEKAADYIIANADQLWSFSQIVGGMAKNKDGNFLITYKDSDGDEHHNDNFSGKTVKLISNINLGDKEDASNNLFYPIGYYNDKASYDKQDGVSTAANVTSFRGTFDGNGHTIANFYQNTWQMWGNYDGNNYKAGMGLFGYVNGGTVKNLTVDHFSSDGEFTPTGVIAAYAAGNATFENIAITNCNPRVYNTGNGGIIGIAGNTSGGDNITLKNITVNSSNKITALWGSWDVACGGLAGMFRGNENGNTISFKNCHVAAQIDVFNDVCANYQYYAYRYSGMMIGSVRNNVTQNGYSYPNTAGISAEKCTVHYETWNDYYYCELVANTKASYTHDYQFSRLERVAKVDGNSVTYLDGSEETITGTRNFVVVSGDHATENATCYHFVKGEIWEHADAGKETVGGVEIDVEDHAHIYLPFRQLFTGYGWGVTSKWLDAFGGVGVTERDTTDMIDKFEKNAALSGNFLYRVGNKNAFPIGKLFQETGKDAVVDSGVYVSVTPLIEGVTMDGTFVKKDAWEDSTLHITGGTGPAKLTIQDYNNCKTFELIVEIVDAYNDDTSKAQESDVVLLSNTTSSGFTVSNGHTFYGNGFKVNCSGKGTYLNHGGMTRGYVNVEGGGVLDNTQVVCDIYPQAFVYTSEVKVESNLDTQASETGKSRYMYQLSAIAVSGDGSTVSNCYAYGGRNNIYVGGGNVRIENTVTECGTLANIQIKSTEDNTVILKNVVSNQYQTKSNYDTSKNMLGFGILVGDNESTSNPTLSIQNNLTQYNWVTSADTNVSNDYAKQAIEAALKEVTYKHTQNGTTTVNTGIIYLNSMTATIDDQRVNHGYVLKPVSMNMKNPTTGLSGNVNAQVYSLGTNSGNYETNEDVYKPTTQGDVLPTINFNLGTQAVVGEDRYLKGDINGIEARFEEGQEAFSLDITKLLSASKHGVKLSVSAICLDPDGNEYSGIVTINNGGTYTLKFTVEDDIFFTSTGELLTKTVEREYTVPLVLTIAEPAIADATIKISSKSGSGSYVDKSSDGSKNLSLNLLGNVSVTDAGSSFDLKSNGGSAEITYSKTTNGYGDAFNGVTTIKVTYQEGQVLTMKLEKISGNTPGDPKSIEYDVTTGTVKSSNKLAKSSCTEQKWQVYEYSFKGLNGKTITNDTVVTITVDADTSGGGCVTGDTLVTLADGTLKRVDALVGNELLVAWDFYKGEYTVAPVGAIVNHGYDVVNEVTMQFADGSTIKTLRGHGFYDVSANKFVIIDENNIAEYVGHKFVKYGGTGNDVTTLVSYSVKSTYNEIWTIVTASHFNCVLNGLLTLSPTDFADSPAYLMPFEIGAGMKYDAAKMQADIAKYGQYTYEDFADYCTYEQFLGFAFANWKVAVGKGYIQFEDILYLIETYVNN